ncbi:hypothetical protein KAR91_03235 [Candidatus Pacearchaeota archaeon]|nr:hypothetical protein [Candidatus Pacearchaeota archaeon]
MAIEDFTTYIEVDTPNRLTVAADSITITDLDRDEHAYVYSDKGLDFFNGDFEHLLDVYTASSTTVGALCYNWALGTEIGDFNDIKNSGFLGLVRFKSATTVVRLQLYEIVTGGASYNVNFNGSLNTTYYLKFVRDESIGTFGTLYCYIYSDSDRTVLVETLSLALHEKKDFRYIYPVISESGAASGEEYDGTVSNLELIAAPVPSGGFPFFFDVGHY